MRSDCLFCKMIKNEIPTKKIFENEKVIGIVDIYPQAKTHLLFIHKNHTLNINEMDGESIAEIFSAIKEYTLKNELSENGFRVVTNLGPNARQTVLHTHFHVLGGELLSSFGK